MLVNELFIVKFQKPMIFTILLRSPVSFFYIFTLFLCIIDYWRVLAFIFCDKFLFILVKIVKLTFFPEKVLEIVRGLDFLLMCQKYVLVCIIVLGLFFNYELGRLEFDYRLQIVRISWIEIRVWSWSFGMMIQHGGSFHRF